MLERDYQAKLITKIEDLLPGCVVLKNDPSYKTGFPDLTILYYRQWAVLEVKASAKAPNQPGQEYYVNYLDVLSFAAFIYPENERDVLHALQRSLIAGRGARDIQREQG